jgi:hypothetical protein
MTDILLNPIGHKKTSSALRHICISAKLNSNGPDYAVYLEKVYSVVLMSGLELYLDEVWRPVTAPPGCLVVNIGEQLGTLKETKNTRLPDDPDTEMPRSEYECLLDIPAILAELHSVLLRGNRSLIN